MSIEALLIDARGNTILMALPNFQKTVRVPDRLPLDLLLRPSDNVFRGPNLSCRKFRWVPPAQPDEPELLVFLYEEE